ncbi:VRR-NUC domain-containing protein [Methylobacterium nodulans]|uniref:VRR-NUC domain protein n=1 Tax=Methylobacterium nodulans (strain LMG 21967 / CNCM I-2342 / ORS 2060) TaxID=460265 RepID=B8IIQ0_METNO|nr:VRR-NUC domain-containing protein [Methylobacterium nodulans]ACL59927.1 VRR-NUC domain protein [Methylobacterium nodulans ORS 2060]
MTRARPEQVIQTKIVVAMHRRFDCRCVHVPNGGRRGKLEGVAFKEMGVEAGHPDLIVYGRGGRCFLIEVKAPGGSLSASQRAFLPGLRERGFPVHVVDSVEDALAAGAAFGLPPAPARPRPAPEPATEF